ncbi:MAG: hypothetical protein WAV00_12135 [Nocardioides sp.]
MAADLVADLRGMSDPFLRAMVKAGTLTETLHGTPEFDRHRRRIGSMAAVVLDERAALAKAADRATLPEVTGWWGDDEPPGHTGRVVE